LIVEAKRAAPVREIVAVYRRDNGNLSPISDRPGDASGQGISGSGLPLAMSQKPQARVQTSPIRKTSPCLALQFRWGSAPRRRCGRPRTMTRLTVEIRRRPLS
jgi:hypothetical protein